jgi:hypothetical protein
MSAFPHDVGGAVEAYAAYLNAPRGILDREEQVLFDEDMARARAAMERAWLESTPVQEVAPTSAAVRTGRGAGWWRSVLNAIKRAAGRTLPRG